MKPTFKNRPNELVVTTDGRKLFHSRSVAVNLVLLAQVVEDGWNTYVAIGKRGKAMPDKSGLWNLPAGYLDFDESAPDAARREAWEEVGLDINEILKTHEIIKEHLEQPWYVKSTPDENRQNVTLRYGLMIKVLNTDSLPVLVANNDCEPNEVDAAMWININELNNYKFAFGHDKVITDYYHEGYNLR